MQAKLENVAWELEGLGETLSQVGYNLVDGCEPYGVEDILFMASNYLKRLRADIDEVVDEYGTDFDLPDGDKSELEQITFTLHHEQAELIKYAIGQIDEYSETFGNTNKNGNAIYELVKQWVELKK